MNMISDSLLHRLITMSKSATQAREDLRREGVTVEKWSTDRGFKPQAVRAVLCGKNKGNFGNGHRIAVALGIKL